MPAQDYKSIFTQLIQKQILVLGPDITFAKVKQVPGIEVDSAGNVINITGNTQQLLQNLINQFVELSGLIVKKTMESILTSQITTIEAQATQISNGSGVPTAGAQAQAPIQTPFQGTTVPVEAVAPLTPAPNENVNELNKMIADMNIAVAEAQKSQGGANV